MENQRENDKTFEKFTWKIKEFSKLASEKLYSESFFIDGHTWQIVIFPKRKEGRYTYLSIYLNAGDAATLPCGWSKSATFKVSLVNQINAHMTLTRESTHLFDSGSSECIGWGFIPLGILCCSNSEYIVNDTCIVEVEILVSKSSKDDNQVTQQVNKIDNPLFQEIPLISSGDLVDFRDLGKVEKAFVPMLEEVCSQHPSLVESRKKRSGRFTQWAFTALGRVLHFLKTKKVKDMNDETCDHLRMLWEELETFGFDLSWLQPHVHYALSMKNYEEKDVKLRKMKENLTALKMKKKKLKAEIVATEVDLEILKRELMKEGFQERDLNAELGYGGMSSTI